MKKWNAPEVAEVKLSNTQYGGTNDTEWDDLYVNAEGNYEATFIPS